MITHFLDPIMDSTLCGEADEGGIDLIEQPPITNYGDIVTCKRCLQIIVACKQYSLVSKDDIKEACKDGWHKEKNMWGYVICDCAGCQEARTQIAKRIIGEYVSKMKARKFGIRERPTLKHCLIWLNKESE